MKRIQRRSTRIRNLFVCLDEEIVLSAKSHPAADLLKAIKDHFDSVCDVHQCVFGIRPSYGRGSCSSFEWREPPTNFADALVVAPVRAFNTDVHFELRRPSHAFPVPTLMLHRYRDDVPEFSVGNVSISGDSAIFSCWPWPNGATGDATELIERFLHERGLI